MISLALNKKSATYKAIAAFCAVAAAVALPQLFHAIGVASGLGSGVGAAFLPMHIPVLLAGFLCGPVVGLLVGILSPLVSFMLSGMPIASVLPFMLAELTVYGVSAGILSKIKLNSFVKLLISQLAGRAARAGAILLAIFAFGNTQLTTASIGTFITAGLFGIVLQWAFIPLLLNRIDGKHCE